MTSKPEDDLRLSLGGALLKLVPDKEQPRRRLSLARRLSVRQITVTVPPAKKDTITVLQELGGTTELQKAALEAVAKYSGAELLKGLKEGKPPQVPDLPDEAVPWLLDHHYAEVKNAVAGLEKRDLEPFSKSMDVAGVILGWMVLSLAGSQREERAAEERAKLLTDARRAHLNWMWTHREKAGDLSGPTKSVPEMLAAIECALRKELLPGHKEIKANTAYMHMFDDRLSFTLKSALLVCKFGNFSLVEFFALETRVEGVLIVSAVPWAV